MSTSRSARLVLFVEDDADIRALYGAALRGGGLSVDEVVTVEEAIEVAARLKPDAVVLDRHLPDGDGWQVARYLRQDPSTKEIPIVAFTSHIERADVENAIVAGCDVFVPKPCDPSTLVRHVKGLLDAVTRPS
jgi:CheY-like chemotaxis protein